MKKISKRIVTLLIVAVMLVGSTVSALASGSNDVRTYSWLQKTNPTFEEPCGTIDMSKDTVLIFQGVATSSKEGTFKVKLQKKGFLGIWGDTNNVYTVAQHHDQTYDTENKHNVTGQFFRLHWNIHEKGEYRVVLYNPTEPQVCGLSSVILYGQ